MKKIINCIPWCIKSTLRKGLRAIVPITLLIGMGTNKVNANSFYENIEKENVVIRLIHSDKSIVAQDFSVSGTISDTNGNLLPGASIVEKGTKNGVQSDFDGNFIINLSSSKSIIVVSFIGFATQEIEVDGQERVAIVLEESAAGLDEVVVVGYGSQKKSDLTGAIVQVNSEDFVKGANTSALQLLNGKASGVHISQTSSQPGGDIDIKIRGVNSINASNSVLVVIDGLPGGSVTAISPDDIESIEVLKDASASAIYGSRGANGVVLITTKKGRKGQMAVTYNGYVGFQSVKDKIDMLNGEEYLTVLNEINVASGGGVLHSPEKIAAVGKGYDWQDIIFRNSVIQSHQLSFQGGSDKSQYYVGLNYLDNEGVVQNTGERKYNARINYQLQPNDKFTFNLNLSANRSERDGIRLGQDSNEGAGVITSALLFDPTIGPERNEEGYFDINPLVNLENPMALLQGIDIFNVQNTIYATTLAEYEILKGLKAAVRLGTDIRNSRRDSYLNDQTQSGRGINGSGSISTSESVYWMTEYLLTYDMEYRDHNLKLLGGTTFENFENRSVGAGASDFLSHVTTTNLLQSGNRENFSVNSSKFVNTLHSYLGRLNYSYKDKYLLTASLRVDGTSKFSDKNKYAYFPSASVGWKLSSEPFMEQQDLFNNLKFRVGYGLVGNQGINNFETIPTFVAGSNAIWNGEVHSGASPARIPNQDLVWETTSELNLGLDFALFNSRLSGSVEYYTRNTKDQLFRKPVPLSTGFNDVRVNFGEVRNSGVDLSLNSINIKNPNFTWETDFVTSFVKNKVIKLPEFAQEIIYGDYLFSGNYLIIKEGAPMASLYGYQIDGIFQNGDDIANSPQPNAQPGHPIFHDTNVDGTISADDKVILGNPFPDMTFGFNNRFSYKNFGLDIYFLGVTGVQTFNNLASESLYPINKDRNHMARHYLDRWTVDNPGGKYPSGVNYTSYSNSGNKVNSFTVQDASFVRLKNITLSYDFPLRNTELLSSANFFISAENLLTFTSKEFDGYDPDANSDGVGASRGNFGDYPLPAIIRLGCKIGF